MKPKPDLTEARKAFEHATWHHANSQKSGANWPALYDAGELGFCLLEWSSACGGHWTNRWFDKSSVVKGKLIKL